MPTIKELRKQFKERGYLLKKNEDGNYNVIKK